MARAKKTDGAPVKAAKVEKAPVDTDGKVSLIDRSKYKYEASGEKTASGRKSVDNGDAVGTALRGLTVEEIMTAVTESGGEVKDRWSELNVGMQRMNAGNVLRKLYKTKGRIKIKGKWVNNPDGAQPAPEKKAAPAKAAAPANDEAKPARTSRKKAA